MITTATLAHGAAILELQKRAYQSEAALYPTLSLPPLQQTLEQLHQEITDQPVLCALEQGVIVGSVRGVQDQLDWVIGRLIVEPSFQGKGVGSRLLKHIEDSVPSSCDRLVLFTGHKSEQNLSMYKTRGYVVFKEVVMGPELTLVYLSKGLNV